MGLLLEMFNSGSRGVLCKIWFERILHTNNVKGVQKFCLGPELQLPCFTTKKHPENRTGDQQALNTPLLLSPWAGGITHQHAQEATSFGKGATFFLQWRDKIVFARKGQNKSELRMDVKQTVTF